MDAETGVHQPASRVAQWAAWVLPFAALPFAWAILVRIATLERANEEPSPWYTEFLGSAGLPLTVVFGAICVAVTAHLTRVLVASNRTAVLPHGLALIPLLAPGGMSVLITTSSYRTLLFDSGTHGGPVPWEDVVVLCCALGLIVRIVTLVFVGVMGLAVALAAALDFRSPERIAHLAVSVSAAIVGLSAMVAAQALAAARVALFDAFENGTSFASLAPSISDYRSAMRASSVLILSAVLLSVGAAFRWWHRGAGLRGLAAILFVPALGLGLRAELMLDEHVGDAVLAEAAPSVFVPEDPGATLDEASLSRAIAARRRRCGAWGCRDEAPAIRLAVDERTQGPALAAALARVSREGSRSVELVRTWPPPPPAPSVFDVARRRNRGGTESVLLRFKVDGEEGCAAGSGSAPFDARNLPCRDLGPAKGWTGTSLMTAAQAAMGAGEVAQVSVEEPK